jgi:hypothetical protein
MRLSGLLCAILVLAPVRGNAQSADSTGRVEIRTSAQTHVELPATSAVLTVEMSVSRKTPGDAGRANAERATAIRRAIISLGVAADSVTTGGYRSGLDVSEERRQDTVFIASNTIQVRISRLELVSAVIDTALAEGATSVSNLQFRAQGMEEARLGALGDATRRARAQAEAMAKAAGGRVGRLLELATDPPANREARPFVGLGPVIATLSRERSMTPIQAPTVSTFVTVYSRWEFLPDPE